LTKFKINQRSKLSGDLAVVNHREGRKKKGEKKKKEKGVGEKRSTSSVVQHNGIFLQSFESPQCVALILKEKEKRGEVSVTAFLAKLQLHLTLITQPGDLTSTGPLKRGEKGKEEASRFKASHPADS